MAEETGTDLFSRLISWLRPNLSHYQPVFVERRYFEYCLANLQEWKQVYELEVFGYYLMTNHVHLVVQANDNLTGGNKFVDEIENRIGIRVETRKPGRPASGK